MDSSEFDAAIGGSEELPDTVNSFRFATSRSFEISALTDCIIRPSKTKLIFQELPVHMRRRVMSHNCKRLPKRLRDGHLEQLKKSGLPPKQKKPSRKYRRRPGNLLQEYTRRQRRNIWLETHIWHAKRFHMVERWGHRLANHPCDKAFRACYRASSAHCLMQDISYINTIKISGDSDIIKKMFSTISSSACGLSIGAKAYMNGSREGTINLYMPNTYPYGFIGKVNYLWTHTSESNHELWLFTHPSQAKQIESVLINIKNGTDNIPDTDTNIKRRKIMNRYSDIQVQVVIGLNRFRLTGPKSHAILFKTLKTINNLDNFKHCKWILDCTEKKLSSFIEEKHSYWLNTRSISAPSQLPPKIVISLIVKDPRLSRPAKRTKAQRDINAPYSTENFVNIPPYLAYSPIWNNKIRDIIKDTKVTNAQFIEHITETQIVPGEILEDDPKLQCVPIVLIQRPGSQSSDYKKIGYGNGWDIIIPPGYGLPFWLTFVMFGARTGGLRETENVAFEMGENYFAPDSESGKTEETREELELKEKYFRRPPSKRVNFIKLSVCCPFASQWQILLNDWSNKRDETFYVLRDKAVINELQECITNKRNISNTLPMNCLVAVYLQVIGKGNLKKHALICMPNAADITSKKSFLEPHHEDGNAGLRKQKRIEHKKVLKSVRKINIKKKKKGDTQSILDKRKLQKLAKNTPSDYVKSMRELWLPSDVITVRNAGIRQTMGYLVHGAFSFSEAKSCGVGYIASGALHHMLDKGINKVLVRNITSRCYRLANFELIKTP